ncbi:TBC1 domain family member 13 protein [Pelomyxa schiedti]|nr:TBC1 domain family member 13 protein [Pelomyxa schiedti]
MRKGSFIVATSLLVLALSVALPLVIVPRLVGFLRTRIEAYEINRLLGSPNELAQVSDDARLWLSDYPTSLQVRVLREHNIGRVISVVWENVAIPPTLEQYYNVTYLHIRSQDRDEQDLLSIFPLAMQFIENNTESNTLVHCMGGVSRSATIATAYLMLSRKYSVEEAITHLREHRPQANPNRGFRRQLEQWKECIQSGTTQNCKWESPYSTTLPVISVVMHQSQPNGPHAHHVLVGSSLWDTLMDYWGYECQGTTIRIEQFRECITGIALSRQAVRDLAIRGIPNAPGLRPTYWKILLNYLPLVPSKWPAVYKRSRANYWEYHKEIIETAPPTEDDRVWDQILKDVHRTFSSVELFNNEAVRTSLKNILFLYAKLNPGTSYVQGMNELVAHLFYVFFTDTDPDTKENAEPDTFFCFTNLMTEVEGNFLRHLDQVECGINYTIDRFSSLIQRYDPELWSHFQAIGMEPHFFALRWITLLYSQEFGRAPQSDPCIAPSDDLGVNFGGVGVGGDSSLKGAGVAGVNIVVRLWDAFFADDKRFELTLYFGCALLLCLRSHLLNGVFEENLGLLQAYPQADFDKILDLALQLRSSPNSVPSYETIYKIPQNPPSPTLSFSIRRAKKKEIKPKNNSIRRLQELPHLLVILILILIVIISIFFLPAAALLGPAITPDFPLPTTPSPNPYTPALLLSFLSPSPFLLAATNHPPLWLAVPAPELSPQTPSSHAAFLLPQPNYHSIFVTAGMQPAAAPCTLTPSAPPCSCAQSRCL